ncbi:hypothetical protein BN1708_020365, partial [Verticillium longisporum]
CGSRRQALCARRWLVWQRASPHQRCRRPR